DLRRRPGRRRQLGRRDRAGAPSARSRHRGSVRAPDACTADRPLVQRAGVTEQTTREGRAMSEMAVEFRAVGQASSLADGEVTPYYLEDSKRRVSVARVNGMLHAFDDLCTCGGRPCPLSSGLLTGTTLMC